MNAIYVEERERERESTAASRCICIFINDFCAFDRKNLRITFSGKNKIDLLLFQLSSQLSARKVETHEPKTQTRRDVLFLATI